MPKPALRRMEPVNSPVTPLRPNPDVIARHLGDGAVLVHIPTNQVYELNHTGARVWELMAGAYTPGVSQAQIGAVIPAPGSAP